MNPTRRRTPLVAFELIAGLVAGACGLIFGVLFLRGMLTGELDGSASGVLFVVAGALIPVVVAVGVWRHVVTGETGWGRTLSIAVIFLAPFSMFGGPLLQAAAVCAILAVVLLGVNAWRTRRLMSRNQEQTI